MKKWLIVLAWLLLPVVGLAHPATTYLSVYRDGEAYVVERMPVSWGAYPQPTPKVYWEQSGGGAVTYFNCVVDGPAPAGTTTNIGLPTPGGTTYSVDITACTGVMVNGTHSVVIQACNTSGCVSATAITVVKL